MKGPFFTLIVAIVSLVQTILGTTTVVTPDIVEQNQNLYPKLNFADKLDTNYEGENPAHSVDGLNLLSSSPSLRLFSPDENLESSFNRLEDDDTDKLSNTEYAPRGINYHQRSKRRRNKRRNNGRRRCRRRGGNSYGNKGGHQEFVGRHLGGGGSQVGEASYGIGAQAAVIGAGSTISGVAVTVDH